MKLFVTSDVHSFYIELIDALHKAGFDADNEEHIFVSCGDLLDRGPDAERCLKFVNSLPAHRKILIRGNHELLASEMIQRGYYHRYDWWNGTADTAQQLCGYTNLYAIPENEAIKNFSNNPDWRRYYNSTVYYKEVGDYIFTHAWIPFKVDEYTLNPKYSENWRSMSFKDVIWKNGMLLWSMGIREPNKTIVCGHFNASWGHENLHAEQSDDIGSYENCRPFEDDGIIALDSMVPISKFLNVKVIEIDSDIFNQSI